MPTRQPVIRLVHALAALWLILLACSFFTQQARAQTTASLTPIPMIQFLDASTGVALPCSGCVLSTFAAGTNTPAHTYTDSTGGSQNPVAITLNSLGMTTSGIWIEAACLKFVLANPAGATLWSQDHVCQNAVTSFNTRTGAVTLAAGDVAAVEQDLRTTANPTFNSVAATTVLNCAATGSNTCMQQASGTFTITGAGDYRGQAVHVGAQNGTIATAGSGAEIDKVGSAVGIQEYDSGGSCGIGTGEASPGIACTSDRRLKRDVRPIEDGLSLILRLLPRTYVWRGSGKSGVGFISQEVEKVMPWLVTRAPEPNPDGILMLSEEGMTPYLVRAVQQQERRIDWLCGICGLLAALQLVLGFQRWRLARRAPIG